MYGPLLPRALDVMRAWGFEYRSDLLIWVKLTPNGKLAFGTGYYTRKNAEVMIYGARGKGLRVVDRSVRQVLFAKRREHSRKPDEFFELLERLFGPVRRIELFARIGRPGWVQWGNELPGENAPASPRG